MSRIILRVDLLWCTAILATLVLPVHAHTGGTTGLATVIVSGQTVQYNLQLPLRSVPTQLADAMLLGQPGLAPDYAPLLKTVEQKIHVRADDTACEAAPGAVTPPPPEGGNAIIMLNFACAAAPKQLTVRDDLFDTLGVDCHTIANKGLRFRTRSGPSPAPAARTSSATSPACVRLTATTRTRRR